MLDAIKDDWVGSETDLADVPLERIDRDNSDLLDDTPIHQHAVDLEGMNYVGAGLVSRPEQPMGTEFDLKGDAVVSVRVEGMHVSEFGAIDPQKGTDDEAVRDYPTTDWDTLTNNIRRSIQTSRTNPNVGRSNTAYKDSFIENWNDQARDYSDYYLLTFDYRLSGFESLP